VASWNRYGLFYYISGFVGYVLLGLYMRRFAGYGTRAKVASLALLCWILGFTICLIWVMAIVYGLASNGFPVNGPTEMIVLIEKPFLHDEICVYLMTVGLLFLFRMIRADGWFYQRVILQISKVGYGIFLSHMIILSILSEWFRDALGIGTDGLLGVFTTPLQIILTAMFSLTISTIVCILIQRIPKYGKWIVG
jgi:peptidoglycan/LPS O-acetylase OafA/YrhL